MDPLKQKVLHDLLIEYQQNLIPKNRLIEGLIQVAGRDHVIAGLDLPGYLQEVSAVSCGLICRLKSR